MLKNTKNKMLAYALTLNPSAVKAQCLHIAGLKIGKTECIAQVISGDHTTQNGALRAATLMVSAGCAKEVNAKKNCYGTFVFEDESKLW